MDGAKYTFSDRTNGFQMTESFQNPLLNTSVTHQRLHMFSPTWYEKSIEHSRALSLEVMIGHKSTILSRSLARRVDLSAARTNDEGKRASGLYDGLDTLNHREIEPIGDENSNAATLDSWCTGNKLGLRHTLCLFATVRAGGSFGWGTTNVERNLFRQIVIDVI